MRIELVSFTSQLISRKVAHRHRIAFECYWTDLNQSEQPSDMQMSTDYKHVKRKDVKISLNIAVDDRFCFEHKNLKERRVLDHHFFW